MFKYFGNFPKMPYDLSGNKNSFDVVTNIFIRTGILNSVKENAFLFYEYAIQESDTPEIIAEKYYGDPGLHWIVLLANNIVDPQYDWPLNYSRFNDYLTGKYGSISAAKSKIDHYEKVIERRDSLSGITTTSKMIIDSDTYNSLPENTYTEYNLVDGTTVAETITRRVIMAYEQEIQNNENKRLIKIIKKEYLEKMTNNLEQIMSSITRINTVLTE